MIGDTYEFLANLVQNISGHHETSWRTILQSEATVFE